MSLLLSHSSSSFMWGVWRMDESPGELARLLQGTTLVEQADRRFSSEHRRQEWLSVRVLLHALLGEHKEIAYQPSGKPYLADNSRHISISHTRGYVAVILGSWPVGIDIEQYGERVQRLSHRFLSPNVVPYFYRGTTTWSLLLHWSGKETVFKCLETGEVDFHEHILIPSFPLSADEGSFPAQEFKTPLRRNFRIHYLIHPDFVLTYHLSEE